MRVVIVNDASVARGGATGLALLQARELAARGIECTFFAADRDPNPDLTSLGVTWRNAGADPLMKAPPHVAATRGLYNRKVAAELSDLIASHDDGKTVYHVHSWSKTLTAAVFAPLSDVANRVFIHAHDFFLACPNGGYMDYQAMEPCARIPLSVDCLTTHCDKRSRAQKVWRVTRQLILRRTLPRTAPWARILMIHPGMEPLLAQAGYPTDRLRALRNPATAPTEARVEAEANNTFLFVGRVEAEKGVEDLVEAAAEADVPLVIAGEGPLREALARRYPKVRFTGWLDRDAIAHEMAQARALVMPSRYPEPFGLVAAEASLSGLPVILSRTALLGPEMEAAGLGFTCDTRNPAAFAASLRKVADMDASEIRTMSETGARGAHGLCTTPDQWIDAQIELYRAAIKAS
ncbi:glycosyltransferase family 4 protein [Jannaschia aquimarina]|uniref:Glycogen synthase n=1 Tax=Jannaschia aquimarina TaxID=935700 RepID=A0A0D1EF98_9RHOB|nr:glycosyltransferase family 4 protein [Jannaschia aquimarina]KIT16294.1 Glycogen synthase [Jannaschia aquimarina]SNT26723.1 Glycosyltransferase involved in cell wall bisynthesis [Jannaschia aquimarina]